MANTLLTMDMITREALRILHQKATFISSINKQYDNSFANEGAKIGSSLRVRLPNQYTVSRGATLVAQDTVEQKVSLDVKPQFQVGLSFTALDLTLSLDDFSKRIIEPAMTVLAASMDAAVLSDCVASVYNQVNNHGSAYTLANVLEARKLLVDNLAPDGDRSVLLSTRANVDLVDSLKGLFQDSTQISKQYTEGYMGRTGGFDFLESTHLSNRSRGAANGFYLINGSVSTGATSVPVDTGTGALVVGDIITIAGVFSVHPETKVSTGQLQQFTVTAAYAGGTGSVAVSPAIYSSASGALQNVSALPADNAAVTVAGTASTNYGTSLAYHKDAFTFATADLVLPKGVDFASRQTYDGISMRIVRDYDINNDAFPCRVDVLGTWGTLRPQLAARIAAR